MKRALSLGSSSRIYNARSDWALPVYWSGLLLLLTSCAQAFGISLGAAPSMALFCAKLMSSVLSVHLQSALLPSKY